jgi:hypothetical protein
MTGFMILIFYIAVLLTIANGAITAITVEKICKLYNLSFDSQFIISMIVGLPLSCIYLSLVLFSRMYIGVGLFNWLYNKVYLAFLIQVGILIMTILLIKLLNKINYNRNIKPYSQIRL